MRRPVLAPLAVALSALLLVPVALADTTSPLFVVEQQRAASVSRLARQWSDAFAAFPKERRLDHEQLSNALFALRADRLIAVTLAGDAEAVEAVLANAKREAAKPRAAAKALGDATADLAYTPVNPCRIPHAGPTAQDFMAAFGLGDNDRMIGFADAQGVAFAAIQGLNSKLEARLAAKDQEIADLKRAVETLLSHALRASGVNPLQ